MLPSPPLNRVASAASTLLRIHTANVQILPLVSLSVQDADEIMESPDNHGEGTSVQTLQTTGDPGRGDGSQAVVSLQA